MPDFDVIIVGGGGAGLAAAIMARKAGASVMVIEADSKLGGATALSAAVLFAAGTSVQKARGLQDSADAMYRYLMTLAAHEADPRIMRLLADGSGPALEWLISLGVEFPPEYLVCSGVEEVPRGHPSKGLAPALINAAGVAGVELALGARVDKLLTDAGIVTGVSIAGEPLTASATIITTGGFGNNPELVKRLYPTAAQHGSWTYSVHKDAPFILGDGVALGENIGAEIVGVDTGLLLPTSGLGKFIEAFLPPWIMLVNEHGRRFMNEAAPYAVSGYQINEQQNARAFAIFDQVALDEGSQDMRFADPYHSGAAMPTWEYNLLKASIENGKIARGGSVSELAARSGLPADALEHAVKRYNANCDDGADREFFKQTPRHFPVRTPPFYAREVRACVIGQTGAGLNISTRAEVLDRLGDPIPGLFAAGEVLGCAVGKRYAGGGMGICNAMVIGRLAGEAAASRARSAR